MNDVWVGRNCSVGCDCNSSNLAEVVKPQAMPGTVHRADLLINLCDMPTVSSADRGHRRRYISSQCTRHLSFATV